MHTPFRHLLLAALLAQGACATAPAEVSRPAAPAAPAAQRPAVPAPPVAERRPHPVTLHGETFQDDYFWLREKQDPRVRAYVEAENAYAEAQLADAGALSQALYGELLGRIQQTDLTVPWRLNGYEYLMRTQEGKQYPTVARRKVGSTGEQLLLDLNALAQGHTSWAWAATS